MSTRKKPQSIEHHISATGLEFLSKLEGSKAYVYYDVAGFPTIGVGHKLTQHEIETEHIAIPLPLGVGAPLMVRYSSGLTQFQILQLLSADAAGAESVVNTQVKVALNQNQFDALCSFCFNVGGGAFAKSTLLKVLNKGQYASVPVELLRWNKVTQHGVLVVSPGLTNRRHAEIALWRTPVPETAVETPVIPPDPKPEEIPCGPTSTTT